MMVEAKCIEDDTGTYTLHIPWLQTTPSNVLLEVMYLVHRAPKYAMPARMWRDGIHSFPDPASSSFVVGSHASFHLPGLFHDGIGKIPCRQSKTHGSSV